MKIHINLIQKIFLTFIFTLTTSQVSLAHSVYFEMNENDQVVIRFGEFGDEYEESPGYLDSLDSIHAWKINGEGQLEVLEPKKQKQGFTIDAKPMDSVSAHSGFPVMTRGSSPARKPFFYARWAHDFKKKEVPRLNLDLVPTGKVGEVQVYFRNKPLAGVKATLFTPEANDQELTADENGIFQFDTDPNEKGLYMLKIGRFREELAGFDRGAFYILTSHNCSLTWQQ